MFCGHTPSIKQSPKQAQQPQQPQQQIEKCSHVLMVRQGERSRGAPAPVVEYISPAPGVSPEPMEESIAPVPAMFQAPTPVFEYLAPAPAVFPAPVEEYISPVPVVDTAPAPVLEFIAPSRHTQFFSLTSVFRQRDTLPDCQWHQESKVHRDSDGFVEIPSCGGRARA